MFLEDDETEGVSITYPGSETSTLQAHAMLTDQVGNNPVNRYDVVMNVDLLKFVIKPPSQDTFSLIQGAWYQSRLSHGARIGHDRENMSINVANAYVGDWNRTHMQPYAYAGATAPNGHRARDEYYFADFCTRIHTDDPGDQGDTQVSHVPDLCRYPDGEYGLKAKITTVTDVQDSSQVYTFTLDNFLPYIKSVLVDLDGDTFYHQEWPSRNTDTTVSLFEHEIDVVILDQNHLKFALNP